MVVIDQIPKGSDVERQPDRSNLSIPIWEQMSSRVALMLGLSVAISAAVCSFCRSYLRCC